MTDFIYLIDLDDFLICHNLVYTKCITSILPTHYQTYKKIHPIYTLDLDKVLCDEKEIQIGFSSPRFSYLILSNWNKNGRKIGIGAPPYKTKFYSDKDIERINRIAELEIEFERVRRSLKKELPSRLSSIYLAPNNIDGRTMLKNMFLNKKKNFIIEQVKLNYTFLLHKADYRWVNEYEKTKKIEFIHNYWNGLQFDKYPQFEYLLEGQVKIENEDTLEKIKNSLKLL